MKECSPFRFTAQKLNQNNETLSSSGEPQDTIEEASPEEIEQLKLWKSEKGIDMKIVNKILYALLGERRAIRKVMDDFKIATETKVTCLLDIVAKLNSCKTSKFFYDGLEWTVVSRYGELCLAFKQFTDDDIKLYRENLCYMDLSEDLKDKILTPPNLFKYENIQINTANLGSNNIATVKSNMALRALRFNIKEAEKIKIALTKFDGPSGIQNIESEKIKYLRNLKKNVHSAGIYKFAIHSTNEVNASLLIDHNENCVTMDGKNICEFTIMTRENNPSCIRNQL